MDQITNIIAIIIMVSIVGAVIYGQKKNEENLRANTPEAAIKGKETKEIPENVSCPLCKGKDLSITEPISPLGWVLIILGLFFTPFFGLGLILIIIGFFVRDRKFYCGNCKRAF